MQEHFRGQRQPTPHVCADIFRSGFQKPCASETPTAATTLALYATCRAAVDVFRRGRLIVDGSASTSLSDHGKSPQWGLWSKTYIRHYRRVWTRTTTVVDN
jgi:hypothetical protein